MNKILMVASAISPRWGSEGYVGWMCLNSIPKNDSVTLLSTPLCIDEVEWGKKNGCNPENLIKLISSNKQWDWRPSHPLVTRINQCWKAKYDVASFYSVVKKEAVSGNYTILHQTTIATWRNGMPYHDLGIPTVWGPIGGGENFPWKYSTIVARKTLIFEILRSLSNKISTNTPSIRNAVRNVDVIICTNHATETKLKCLGRKKPTLLQQNTLPLEKFYYIKNIKCELPKNRLEIFSGGSLEDRKGYSLTLHAISRLKQKGIPVHYTIGGQGLDLISLQKIAFELRLESTVTFNPELNGENYLQQLKKTHILSFPSLRDNSPITLLEAMAAGCIPLVLDNGGPGEIVPDQFCILPLQNPEKTILNLSHKIEILFHNRSFFNDISQKCVKKVENALLNENLTATFQKSYFLAKEYHMK